MVEPLFGINNRKSTVIERQIIKDWNQALYGVGDNYGEKISTSGLETDELNIASFRIAAIPNDVTKYQVQLHLDGRLIDDGLEITDIKGKNLPINKWLTDSSVKVSIKDAWRKGLGIRILSEKADGSREIKEIAINFQEPKINNILNNFKIRVLPKDYRINEKGHLDFELAEPLPDFFTVRVKVGGKYRPAKLSEDRKKITILAGNGKEINVGFGEVELVFIPEAFRDKGKFLGYLGWLSKTSSDETEKLFDKLRELGVVKQIGEQFSIDDEQIYKTRIRKEINGFVGNAENLIKNLAVFNQLKPASSFSFVLNPINFSNVGKKVVVVDGCTELSFGIRRAGNIKVFVGDALIADIKDFSEKTFDRTFGHKIHLSNIPSGAESLRLVWTDISDKSPSFEYNIAILQEAQSVASTHQVQYEDISDYYENNSNSFISFMLANSHLNEDELGQEFIQENKEMLDKIKADIAFGNPLNVSQKLFMFDLLTFGGRVFIGREVKEIISQGKTDESGLLELLTSGMYNNPGLFKYLLTDELELDDLNSDFNHQEALAVIPDFLPVLRQVFDNDLPKKFFQVNILQSFKYFDVSSINGIYSWFINYINTYEHLMTDYRLGINSEFDDFNKYLASKGVDIEFLDSESLPELVMGYLKEHLSDIDNPQMIFSVYSIMNQVLKPEHKKVDKGTNVFVNTEEELIDVAYKLSENHQKVLSEVKWFHDSIRDNRDGGIGVDWKNNFEKIVSSFRRINLDSFESDNNFREQYISYLANWCKNEGQKVVLKDDFSLYEIFNFINKNPGVLQDKAFIVAAMFALASTDDLFLKGLVESLGIIEITQRDRKDVNALFNKIIDGQNSSNQSTLYYDIEVEQEPEIEEKIKQLRRRIQLFHPSLNINTENPKFDKNLIAYLNTYFKEHGIVYDLIHLSDVISDQTMQKKLLDAMLTERTNTITTYKIPKETVRGLELKIVDSFYGSQKLVDEFFINTPLYAQLAEKAEEIGCSTHNLLIYFLKNQDINLKQIDAFLTGDKSNIFIKRENIEEIFSEIPELKENIWDILLQEDVITNEKNKFILKDFSEKKINEIFQNYKGFLSKNNFEDQNIWDILVKNNLITSKTQNIAEITSLEGIMNFDFGDQYNQETQIIIKEFIFKQYQSQLFFLTNKIGDLAKSFKGEDFSKLIKLLDSDYQGVISGFKKKDVLSDINLAKTIAVKDVTYNVQALYDNPLALCYFYFLKTNNGINMSEWLILNEISAKDLNQLISKVKDSALQGELLKNALNVLDKTQEEIINQDFLDKPENKDLKDWIETFVVILKHIKYVENNLTLPNLSPLEQKITYLSQMISGMGQTTREMQKAYNLSPSVLEKIKVLYLADKGDPRLQTMFESYNSFQKGTNKKAHKNNALLSFEIDSMDFLEWFYQNFSQKLIGSSSELITSVLINMTNQYITQVSEGDNVVKSAEFPGQVKVQIEEAVSKIRNNQQLTKNERALLQQTMLIILNSIDLSELQIKAEEGQSIYEAVQSSYVPVLEKAGQKLSELNPLAPITDAYDLTKGIIAGLNDAVELLNDSECSFQMSMMDLFLSNKKIKREHVDLMVKVLEGLLVKLDLSKSDLSLEVINEMLTNWSKIRTMLPDDEGIEITINNVNKNALKAYVFQLSQLLAVVIDHVEIKNVILVKERGVQTSYIDADKTALRSFAVGEWGAGVNQLGEGAKEIPGKMLGVADSYVTNWVVPGQITKSLKEGWSSPSVKNLGFTGKDVGHRLANAAGQGLIGVDLNFAFINLQFTKMYPIQLFVGAFKKDITVRKGFNEQLKNFNVLLKDTELLNKESFVDDETGITKEQSSIIFEVLQRNKVLLQVYDDSFFSDAGEFLFKKFEKSVTEACQEVRPSLNEPQIKHVISTLNEASVINPTKIVSRSFLPFMGEENSAVGDVFNALVDIHLGIYVFKNNVWFMLGVLGFFQHLENGDYPLALVTLMIANRYCLPRAGESFWDSRWGRTLEGPLRDTLYKALPYLIRKLKGNESALELAYEIQKKGIIGTAFDNSITKWFSSFELKAKDMKAGVEELTEQLKGLKAKKEALLRQGQGNYDEKKLKEIKDKIDELSQQRKELQQKRVLYTNKLIELSKFAFNPITATETLLREKYQEIQNKDNPGNLEDLKNFRNADLLIRKMYAAWDFKEKKVLGGFNRFVQNNFYIPTVMAKTANGFMNVILNDEKSLERSAKLRGNQESKSTDFYSQHTKGTDVFRQDSSAGIVPYLLSGKDVESKATAVKELLEGGFTKNTNKNGLGFFREDDGRYYFMINVKDKFNIVTSEKIYLGDVVIDNNKQTVSSAEGVKLVLSRDSNGNPFDRVSIYLSPELINNPEFLKATFSQVINQKMNVVELNDKAREEQFKCKPEDVETEVKNLLNRLGVQDDVLNKVTITDNFKNFIAKGAFTSLELGDYLRKSILDSKNGEFILNREGAIKFKEAQLLKGADPDNYRSAMEAVYKIVRGLEQKIFEQGNKTYDDIPAKVKEEISNSVKTEINSYFQHNPRQQEVAQRLAIDVLPKYLEAKNAVYNNFKDLYVSLGGDVRRLEDNKGIVQVDRINDLLVNMMKTTSKKNIEKRYVNEQNKLNISVLQMLIERQGENKVLRSYLEELKHPSLLENSRNIADKIYDILQKEPLDFDFVKKSKFYQDYKEGVLKTFTLSWMLSSDQTEKPFINQAVFCWLSMLDKNIAENLSAGEGKTKGLVGVQFSRMVLGYKVVLVTSNEKDSTAAFNDTVVGKMWGYLAGNKNNVSHYKKGMTSPATKQLFEKSKVIVLDNQAFKFRNLEDVLKMEETLPINSKKTIYVVIDESDKNILIDGSQPSIMSKGANEKLNSNESEPYKIAVKAMSKMMAERVVFLSKGKDLTDFFNRFPDARSRFFYDSQEGCLIIKGAVSDQEKAELQKVFGFKINSRKIKEAFDNKWNNQFLKHVDLDRGNFRNHQGVEVYRKIVNEMLSDKPAPERIALEAKIMNMSGKLLDVWCNEKYGDSYKLILGEVNIINKGQRRIDFGSVNENRVFVEALHKYGSRKSIGKVNGLSKPSLSSIPITQRAFLENYLYGMVAASGTNVDMTAMWAIEKVAIYAVESNVAQTLDIKPEILCKDKDVQQREVVLTAMRSLISGAPVLIHLPYSKAGADNTQITIEDVRDQLRGFFEFMTKVVEAKSKNMGISELGTKNQRELLEILGGDKFIGEYKKMIEYNQKLYSELYKNKFDKFDESVYGKKFDPSKIMVDTIMHGENEKNETAKINWMGSGFIRVLLSTNTNRAVDVQPLAGEITALKDKYLNLRKKSGFQDKGIVGIMTQFKEDYAFWVQEAYRLGRTEGLTRAQGVVYSILSISDATLSSHPTLRSYFRNLADNFLGKDFVITSKGEVPDNAKFRYGIDDITKHLSEDKVLLNSIQEAYFKNQVKSMTFKDLLAKTGLNEDGLKDLKVNVTLDAFKKASFPEGVWDIIKGDLFEQDALKNIKTIDDLRGCLEKWGIDKTKLSDVVNRITLGVSIDELKQLHGFNEDAFKSKLFSFNQMTKSQVILFAKEVNASDGFIEKLFRLRVALDLNEQKHIAEDEIKKVMLNADDSPIKERIVSGLENIKANIQQKHRDGILGIKESQDSSSKTSDVIEVFQRLFKDVKKSVDSQVSIKDDKPYFESMSLDKINEVKSLPQLMTMLFQRAFEDASASLQYKNKAGQKVAVQDLFQDVRANSSAIEKYLKDISKQLGVNIKLQNIDRSYWDGGYEIFKHGLMQEVFQAILKNKAFDYKAIIPDIRNELVRIQNLYAESDDGLKQMKGRNVALTGSEIDIDNRARQNLPDYIFTELAKSIFRGYEYKNQVVSKSKGFTFFFSNRGYNTNYYQNKGENVKEKEPETFVGKGSGLIRGGVIYDVGQDPCKGDEAKKAEISIKGQLEAFLRGQTTNDLTIKYSGGDYKLSVDGSFIDNISNKDLNEKLKEELSQFFDKDKDKKGRTLQVFQLGTSEKPVFVLAEVTIGKDQIVEAKRESNQDIYRVITLHRIIATSNNSPIDFYGAVYNEKGKRFGQKAAYEIMLTEEHINKYLDGLIDKACSAKSSTEGNYALNIFNLLKINPEDIKDPANVQARDKVLRLISRAILSHEVSHINHLRDTVFQNIPKDIKDLPEMRSMYEVWADFSKSGMLGEIVKGLRANDKKIIGESLVKLNFFLSLAEKNRDTIDAGLVKIIKEKIPNISELLKGKVTSENLTDFAKALDDVSNWVTREIQGLSKNASKVSSSSFMNEINLLKVKFGFSSSFDNFRNPSNTNVSKMVSDLTGHKVDVNREGAMILRSDAGRNVVMEQIALAIDKNHKIFIESPYQVEIVVKQEQQKMLNKVNTQLSEDTVKIENAFMSSKLLEDIPLVEKSKMVMQFLMVIESGEEKAIRQTFKEYEPILRQAGITLEDLYSCSGKFNTLRTIYNKVINDSQKEGRSDLPLDKLPISERARIIEEANNKLSAGSSSVKIPLFSIHAEAKDAFRLVEENSALLFGKKKMLTGFNKALSDIAYFRNITTEGKYLSEYTKERFGGTGEFRPYHVLYFSDTYSLGESGKGVELTNQRAINSKSVFADYDKDGKFLTFSYVERKKILEAYFSFRQKVASATFLDEKSISRMLDESMKGAGLSDSERAGECKEYIAGGYLHPDAIKVLNDLRKYRKDLNPEKLEARISAVSEFLRRNSSGFSDEDLGKSKGRLSLALGSILFSGKSIRDRALMSEIKQEWFRDDGTIKQEYRDKAMSFMLGESFVSKVGTDVKENLFQAFFVLGAIATVRYFRGEDVFDEKTLRYMFDEMMVTSTLIKRSAISKLFNYKNMNSMLPLIATVGYTQIMSAFLAENQAIYSMAEYKYKQGIAQARESRYYDEVNNYRLEQLETDMDSQGRQIFKIKGTNHIYGFEQRCKDVAKHLLMIKQNQFPGGVRLNDDFQYTFLSTDKIQDFLQTTKDANPLKEWLIEKGYIISVEDVDGSVFVVTEKILRVLEDGGPFFSQKILNNFSGEEINNIKSLLIRSYNAFSQIQNVVVNNIWLKEVIPEEEIEKRFAKQLDIKVDDISNEQIHEYFQKNIVFLLVESLYLNLSDEIQSKIDIQSFLKMLHLSEADIEQYISENETLTVTQKNDLNKARLKYEKDFVRLSKLITEFDYKISKVEELTKSLIAELDGLKKAFNENENAEQFFKRQVLKTVLQEKLFPEHRVLKYSNPTEEGIKKYFDKFISIIPKELESNGDVVVDVVETLKDRYFDFHQGKITAKQLRYFLEYYADALAPLGLSSEVKKLSYDIKRLEISTALKEKQDSKMDLNMPLDYIVYFEEEIVELGQSNKKEFLEEAKTINGKDLGVGYTTTAGITTIGSFMLAKRLATKGFMNIGLTNRFCSHYVSMGMGSLMAIFANMGLEFAYTNDVPGIRAFTENVVAPVLNNLSIVGAVMPSTFLQHYIAKVLGTDTHNYVRIKTEDWGEEGKWGAVKQWSAIAAHDTVAVVALDVGGIMLLRKGLEKIGWRKSVENTIHANMLSPEQQVLKMLKADDPILKLKSRKLTALARSKNINVSKEGSLFNPRYRINGNILTKEQFAYSLDSKIITKSGLKQIISDFNAIPGYNATLAGGGKIKIKTEQGNFVRSASKAKEITKNYKMMRSVSELNKLMGNNVPFKIIFDSNKKMLGLTFKGFEGRSFICSKENFDDILKKKSGLIYDTFFNMSEGNRARSTRNLTALVGVMGLLSVAEQLIQNGEDIDWSKLASDTGNATGTMIAFALAEKLLNGMGSNGLKKSVNIPFTNGYSSVFSFATLGASVIVEMGLSARENWGDILDGDSSFVRNRAIGEVVYSGAKAGVASGISLLTIGAIGGAPGLAVVVVGGVVYVTVSEGIDAVKEISGIRESADEKSILSALQEQSQTRILFENNIYEDHRKSFIKRRIKSHFQNQGGEKVWRDFMREQGIYKLFEQKKVSTLKIPSMYDIPIGVISQIKTILSKLKESNYQSINLLLEFNRLDEDIVFYNLKVINEQGVLIENLELLETIKETNIKEIFSDYIKDGVFVVEGKTYYSVNSFVDSEAFDKLMLSTVDSGDVSGLSEVRIINEMNVSERIYSQVKRYLIPTDDGISLLVKAYHFGLLDEKDIRSYLINKKDEEFFFSHKVGVTTLAEKKDYFELIKESLESKNYERLRDLFSDPFSSEYFARNRAFLAITKGVFSRLAKMTPKQLSPLAEYNTDVLREEFKVWSKNSGVIFVSIADIKKKDIQLASEYEKYLLSFYYNDFEERLSGEPFQNTFLEFLLYQKTSNNSFIDYGIEEQFSAYRYPEYTTNGMFDFKKLYEGLLTDEQKTRFQQMIEIINYIIPKNVAQEHEKTSAFNEEKFLFDVDAKERGSNNVFQNRGIRENSVLSCHHLRVKDKPPPLIGDANSLIDVGENKKLTLGQLLLRFLSSEKGMQDKLELPGFNLYSLDLLNSFYMKLPEGSWHDKGLLKLTSVVKTMSPVMAEDFNKYISEKNKKEIISRKDLDQFLREFYKKEFLVKNKLVSDFDRYAKYMPKFEQVSFSGWLQVKGIEKDDNLNISVDDLGFMVDVIDSWIEFQRTYRVSLEKGDLLTAYQNALALLEQYNLFRSKAYEQDIYISKIKELKEIKNGLEKMIFERLSEYVKRHDINDLSDIGIKLNLDELIISEEYIDEINMAGLPIDEKLLIINRRIYDNLVLGVFEEHSEEKNILMALIKHLDPTQFTFLSRNNSGCAIKSNVATFDYVDSMIHSVLVMSENELIREAEGLLENIISLEIEKYSLLEIEKTWELFTLILNRLFYIDREIYDKYLAEYKDMFKKIIKKVKDNKEVEKKILKNYFKVQLYASRDLLKISLDLNLLDKLYGLDKNFIKEIEKMQKGGFNVEDLLGYVFSEGKFDQRRYQEIQSVHIFIKRFFEITKLDKKVTFYRELDEDKHIYIDNISKDDIIGWLFARVEMDRSIMSSLNRGSGLKTSLIKQYIFKRYKELGVEIIDNVITDKEEEKKKLLEYILTDSNNLYELKLLLYELKDSTRNNYSEFFNKMFDKIELLMDSTKFETKDYQQSVGILIEELSEKNILYLIGEQLYYKKYSSI